MACLLNIHAVKHGLNGLQAKYNPKSAFVNYFYFNTTTPIHFISFMATPMLWWKLIVYSESTLNLKDKLQKFDITYETMY